MILSNTVKTIWKIAEMKRTVSFLGWTEVGNVWLSQYERKIRLSLHGLKRCSLWKRPILGILVGILATSVTWLNEVVKEVLELELLKIRILDLHWDLARTEFVGKRNTCNGKPSYRKIALITDPPSYSNPTSLLIHTVGCTITSAAEWSWLENPNKQYKFRKPH